MYECMDTINSVSANVPCTQKTCRYIQDKQWLFQWQSTRQLQQKQSRFKGSDCEIMHV